METFISFFFSYLVWFWFFIQLWCICDWLSAGYSLFYCSFFPVSLVFLSFLVFFILSSFQRHKRSFFILFSSFRISLFFTCERKKSYFVLLQVPHKMRSIFLISIAAMPAFSAKLMSKLSPENKNGRAQFDSSFLILIICEKVLARKPMWY